MSCSINHSIKILGRSICRWSIATV